MLVAQQLAAQRGFSPLFAGVGFTLHAGEALHVTGANGSGKTTLLRMVCGLTRPAQGTLAWRGADGAAALRECTLYVGHASALKDDLTAEQNLHSLSTLHGETADERAVQRALAEWNLDAQRALPARALSQGQRRRVALARLRLTPRELWVLDEPTSALDAAGVDLLREHLRSHAARGGLAIIASHDTRSADGAGIRELRL
ncbi:MAG: cytochrome c biogenesis heme-transporting ATPase CcmA [Betaproteobacteria bacterium]